MKYLPALVLLAPAFVNAQVVITEIMYDLAEGSDSGREWIEIYNAGSVTVDVATWKVFENGTNHKLAAVGATQLPPQTYAVIADNAEKFNADWPAFSGLLFDSAFSLSNSGETITLRNSAGADIDSLVYADTMGGKGTGDSLQRFEGAFAAGMPTPGAGIPAGGLVPSPQKTTAKAAQQAAAAATPVEIRGEVVADTPDEVLVAAAPVAGGSSALWWLGPFLLAGLGGTGVVWSRYLRRDEWEIEEMTESG